MPDPSPTPAPGPRRGTPKNADLLKLPRWARVVLLARCARRVQHAVSSWSGATTDLAKATDSAITESEMSARLAAPSPQVLGAAMQLRTLSKVIVTLDVNTEESNRVADASTAMDVAWHAAMLAGGMTEGSARQPEKAIFDSTLVGILQTVKLQDAFVAERAIWSDYDRLLNLAQSERWTDDTPVEPDRLGPLWPTFGAAGGDVPWRLTVEFSQPMDHLAAQEVVRKGFGSGVRLSVFWESRDGHRETLDAIIEGASARDLDGIRSHLEGQLGRAMYSVHISRMPSEVQAPAEPGAMAEGGPPGASDSALADVFVSFNGKPSREMIEQSLRDVAGTAQLRFSWDDRRDMGTDLRVQVIGGQPEIELRISRTIIEKLGGLIRQDPPADPPLEMVIELSGPVAHSDIHADVRRLVGDSVRVFKRWNGNSVLLRIWSAADELPLTITEFFREKYGAHVYVTDTRLAPEGDNASKSYGEMASPRSGKRLVVRLAIPEDATDEEAAAIIEKVGLALSERHRQLGGSGLKLETHHSEFDVGVKAPVGNGGGR